MRGEQGDGQRGDIVLGWLTKLVVVLALFGVAAFDSLSIAVARVSISDDAVAAAQSAADNYRSSHDVQAAYNAAVAALSDKPHDTIPTDSFGVDGTGTAHVVVHRSATTLVLFRIHPLAHYATVTAAADAHPLVS